uniref:Multiple C2 domains, transmembrane 2a n=1 Tax=Fundulus heteroclitus TaxID=8078 RepID=A0A3Q2NWL9_FUNHE
SSLTSITLKTSRNLCRWRSTSDPYVKFKLEGKQFYKSKVVYKDLNPRWNESFSHPLRDRHHDVELRVGLQLEDPKSKEDDMGVIVVEVHLTFRDATVKRGPNQCPTPRLSDSPKNQLKNQMWSGVLSITLVEGQDLPQYGQGDVYVRFRLGDQKYKSKNLCIQPNPQWREQFDFNHFEDVQEPLQVEVTRIPSRLRCKREPYGSHNRLHLFIYFYFFSTIDFFQSLKNSHKCLQDVGFLQVSVLKANDLPATDINGKSNPFCVIELGNCKLQTQTVYRTVNPEWNKVFTFPIKDIHDVVEVTVFDENGDRSPNLLGKIAIPLLTVQNGQQVSLLLKKDDLGRTSKGTITLLLDVIYNKVRAGVRTFQPKEVKLTEENPKFNKKVICLFFTAVLHTLQYIKSCFQWESRQRSLIAFLIFLVTVWHWELFMLPLFLLLLIGWNYIQLSREKASSNQELVSDEESEPGKKGLMDKIHMVQEVVLVVQNVLEEIANIGERVKNIFNWSVPFMSCLAGLVLFVAAFLLYLIPLRYIVLVWGINKFTKKLRSPYTIDSNEILDFLQRVPSDVQKVRVQFYIQIGTEFPEDSQPRKKK